MARSAERCADCGTVLPSTAVYCPECGAATGTVRIEPIDGPDETSSAEVVLGVQRRRWIAPVIVAGVVALVAGVAVFGGKENDSLTAPPVTTTPMSLVPTTTTATTVPATTTTLFSNVQASAVPDAAGVVVYVSTNDGDILRVDVGSGVVERRAVVPRGRNGPWVLMGRRGGVVLASASWNDQSPIVGLADGPDTSPVPLVDWQPVELAMANPQAVAAAEPDEVWVWNQFDSAAVSVKRVRIDGAVTAGPVTLPTFATVLGADGPGALALSGPDGMYRATIDGQSVQVERVSPRVPTAYNTTSLLDLNCTTSLECGLEVVDRASGTSHTLSQDPPDLSFPYFESVLSPDSAWLAHVSYIGEGPKLSVYALSGDGTPFSHQILAATSFGPLGSPTSYGFSPDGRWLVFLGLPGDIQLWKVGSTKPPITVDVPGLFDVSALSVAPG